MIEFEKKFIFEWKNSIIFAPNSFGKTTLSKRIKKEIEKENPDSCLLFTRRQMDDLMSFSKNSFYFGDSAIYRNKNKIIQNNFEESTIFRDFISSTYNVKSALALKDISLFFTLSNLKNLNTTSLLQLSLVETPVSLDYGLAESVKLDNLLNINIYNSLTNEIIHAKEPKFKKSKTYISNSIFNILQELCDYAFRNKLDYCPLCGKKFADNEKLKLAINKRLKKYEILSETNPATFVNDFYNAICSKLLNESDDIIMSIFSGIDQETITFAGKIKVLINYKKICDNNNSLIKRALRNLKINGIDVGSLVDNFNDNLTRIKNSDKKVNQRKRTLDFIKEEFDKIASYSEASIKLDYENMSISIEGQETKKQNIGDILSESESKRLCLAVLRAKVKYGKYSTIILDDPIDSYDDYYVGIVCSYIAALVKERKVSDGYYIFTNNNNALYRLSAELKCNSIIMYEDPDEVFLTCNTKNKNYLTLSATYHEIESINKSEIVLLYEYLTSPPNGTNFDNELAFIAFLTTMRNIKTTILGKYENFEISFNSQLCKDDFSERCKEIIEHLYMHYEPGYFGRSSMSALMSEAFDLYQHFMPIRNRCVLYNSSNFNSIILQRERISKMPFRQHSGNKLVALIFKKIVFISELKFKFESIVLDKLENKFGYSKNDIDSIAKTNSGFMSKMKKARAIDNKTGKRASKFIDLVIETHKKHSNLINEFDHALNLMYPPYLNTRIFDIKKYKNDIEKINNTY